jgi:hypothetical protein
MRLDASAYKMCVATFPSPLNRTARSRRAGPRARRLPDQLAWETLSRSAREGGEQLQITNPFARPQIASSVKYGWKLRLPLWNLTSGPTRSAGMSASTDSAAKPRKSAERSKAVARCPHLICPAPYQRPESAQPRHRAHAPAMPGPAPFRTFRQPDVDGSAGCKADTCDKQLCLRKIYQRDARAGLRLMQRR